MKTTAEMIVVMQAYDNGKRIRCRVRDGGEWFSLCKPPRWDWVEYDYEIKREPLERWVNVYGHVNLDTMFDSPEKARQNAALTALRVAVHMHEVTGEDDG